MYCSPSLKTRSRTKNQQFMFEVAFYEPEISEPKAVVETLESFVKLVSDTVAKFKPFLG